MKDIMVDIETLGVKPGCVIMSIGAVSFNPKKLGSVGQKKFYANIDPQDSISRGFHTEKGTVEWWKKQSEEAKQHLIENRQPIETVVTDFIDWWRKQKGEKIWCQGANFDAPLLEAVFEKLELKAPWKFWNVRDTRTIYDMCDFNPYSIKREGTYHDALDDCLHQIKCVQTAWSSK